jgi:hypothetical protein
MDSDSVVEFANDEASITGGTSKAYAMHDVSTRTSDLEARDCIHVHSETIVDYGKV